MFLVIKVPRQVLARSLILRAFVQVSFSEPTKTPQPGTWAESLVVLYFAASLLPGGSKAVVSEKNYNFRDYWFRNLNTQ